MKKKLTSLLATASLLTLVGCGGTDEVAQFDLTKALADGELGYVVLIGEQGNPEAEDRTKGCDEALAAAAKEYGFTAKKLGEKVCIDTNGNPWNDQIAKETVEGWASQFKGKLDFIVSNNDGMAIAAAGVSSLPKGTPIVGFDALSAACDMIKAGTLAGSVSQNGDDQALAVVRALTSLINGSETIIDANYGGKAELNLGDLDKHIIQTKFAAVTAQNADQLKPGAYVNLGDDKPGAGKKILVAYYSANDNFIRETYQSALPHYAKALGYEVDEVFGDGLNDALLVEQIQTKVSANNYDGFAFNVITHSNYENYLSAVGDKPVVFFNRQPKKSDDSGVADLSTKQKVYFVGSGSTGQGVAQGQIIKDWFAANYKKA